MVTAFGNNLGLIEGLGLGGENTQHSHSFSVEPILHCPLDRVSYFGISLHHQKVSDVFTSPVGRDRVVVVVKMSLFFPTCSNLYFSVSVLVVNMQHAVEPLLLYSDTLTAVYIREPRALNLGQKIHTLMLTFR